MAMPSEELEALALRCVREGLPVWELVKAITYARNMSFVDVVFGECHDRLQAKAMLSEAEMAAFRPIGWKEAAHAKWG